MAIRDINEDGNCWENEATGVSGLSNVIELSSRPFVTFFGNVNGTTVITVEVSPDGSVAVPEWFDSQIKWFLTSGDFMRTIQLAAPYLRLRSSADVTADISAFATSGA